MCTARPIVAIVVLLVSFGMPRLETASPVPKAERGIFSRDAVFVCSPPRSATPIRIPSPDGKKVIVVTSDRDRDLPHAVVTVEAFDKNFEAGFTWSPDCEVAWSPDSRAFFATYTKGGAVGGYVTQIFFVRPEGLDVVDPTENLVKEFISRPRYCLW